VCGVVAGVGADPAVVSAMTDRLRHRGPDAFGLWQGQHVSLGHTRLAIIDPDPRSNQPFRYGTTVISYNGETWNHRELRLELEGEGHRFVTESDTEVVAHALDAWGPAALPRLHGMFAIAWSSGDGTLHLARDRFGEVPLHYAPLGQGLLNEGWIASSEIKAMPDLPDVHWVLPGVHLQLRAGEAEVADAYVDVVAEGKAYGEVEAQALLVQELHRSCRERAMSDVPVCTLVSGGIDSAVVAYHLREYVPNLVCYVAVQDESSADVRNARLVAEALELELREVAIPQPTQPELEEVVRLIEMPHKAQVEIAWACLHLARAMAADGFKVTFSGEGADELFASYQFSQLALRDGADWFRYRRDLFVGQHRKNFARTNKVFLQYGVECRLPFLHVPLVELCLSMPRPIAEPAGKAKDVLRAAYLGELPYRVVHRQKMAFQDGLGDYKSDIQSMLVDPRRSYKDEFSRSYPGAVA
jgi:asparagine synthase (glutamine-hydrolysing)